jgi:2-methylcitrate dehydratase PrpD
MAPVESLTEALVDTLLSEYGATGDSLPSEAAARLLCDHWACRLAGDAVLPVRWQPEAVARQAAAASVLDRDDVHWKTFTHPGSIIWPVVLDVGWRTDADGAGALRAAVLGYEVSARLAEALGPSHRRYWHTTATAGTVGAAMSAAVLLGLDAPGIVTALGHAISVTGGSSRSIVERSATKVFHRAHAARTGVACAEAASLAPATRQGLEPSGGMLAAMSSAPDPERLVAPVGRWAIEETAIRLYAVSGFAHAAVEAACRLAGSVDHAGITRIGLAVSPATRTLAGIALPTTNEEAWWSVQHAVAACLIHGDPSVLESGLQNDPRVLLLLGRMQFDDDRDGIGATVTVEWADGRHERVSVDLPTGHADRPASTEQMLTKWSALTGDRDHADRLLATARRFGSERLRDVVAEAGMANDGARR